VAETDRTPEETAFLIGLETCACSNLNFKLVATITASKDPFWPHEFGRIDEEMLIKHLREIHDSIYYLPGLRPWLQPCANCSTTLA
jgi:hypothetical protein